jgi:putative transposase
MTGTPLFCTAFREILKGADVKTVKLPPKSPNLNPHAERFVRSVKEECLNRLILFGESHLRTAVRQYVEHYHIERPHQGLGNELITPANDHGTGAIECHERLGGLLKSYYRRAA